MLAVSIWELDSWRPVVVRIGVQPHNTNIQNDGSLLAACMYLRSFPWHVKESFTFTSAPTDKKTGWSAKYCSGRCRLVCLFFFAFLKTPPSLQCVQRSFWVSSFVLSRRKIWEPHLVTVCPWFLSLGWLLCWKLVVISAPGLQWKQCPRDLETRNQNKNGIYGRSFTFQHQDQCAQTRSYLQRCHIGPRPQVKQSPCTAKPWNNERPNWAFVILIPWGWGMLGVPPRGHQGWRSEGCFVWKMGCVDLDLGWWVNDEFQALGFPEGQKLGIVERIIERISKLIHWGPGCFLKLLW